MDSAALVEMGADLCYRVIDGLLGFVAAGDGGGSVPWRRLVWVVLREGRFGVCDGSLVLGWVWGSVWMLTLGDEVGYRYGC